jgi:hypothetical protein
VGAAAGIVVQTLIGKKLNQAARSSYRVTGSWEKPVIALVGKGSAKEQRSPADGKPATTDPVSGGASAAANTAPAHAGADSATRRDAAVPTSTGTAPSEGSELPGQAPSAPATPAVPTEKSADRPAAAEPPKEDEPDPKTGARTRRG